VKVLSFVISVIRASIVDVLMSDCGTCVVVVQAASEASELELQASIELEKARPALELAKEAVNCLDKTSLTELKAMQKPPAGVDIVMKVVLIMLANERKNLSWEAGKKLMANVSQFKARLENYRCEPRLSLVVLVRFAASRSTCRD
jgi:hypothetical protein